MKTHELVIELDEHGHGRVELDGHPLNTTRIEFESNAGKPTLVKLSLVAMVTAKIALAEHQDDDTGITSIAGFKFDVDVTRVEVTA